MPGWNLLPSENCNSSIFYHISYERSKSLTFSQDSHGCKYSAQKKFPFACATFFSWKVLFIKLFWVLFKRSELKQKSHVTLPLCMYKGWQGKGGARGGRRSVNWWSIFWSASCQHLVPLNTRVPWHSTAAPGRSWRDKGVRRSFTWELEAPSGPSRGQASWAGQAPTQDSCTVHMERRTEIALSERCKVCSPVTRTETKSTRTQAGHEGYAHNLRHVLNAFAQGSKTLRRH